MTLIKTKVGRRSFLKSSALAGGGMMLGFSWLVSCKPTAEKEMLAMPKEWFDINGFLKIGENGIATIMAPNPEFGQNVKTSMPMIIAEELDIDWKNVLVEQAAFNTDIYTRQFAGGSQSIRQGWDGLRMAGASARHMLRGAAAEAWQVPLEEITTEAGILYHKKSGKSASYGEMASAAASIPVPEEVELKEVKDFKIVSSSKKNVDGKKIVTGQATFGLDFHREGMLIAMIVHPPAFGLKFKSMEDASVRSMSGIKDVFTIKTFDENFEKAMFNTNAFPELVAIVGNSTWEVMNAKKALKVDWEPIPDSIEKRNFFGNKHEARVPSGLENTSDHIAQMNEMASKPGNLLRKDGDPEAAFQKAAKVIKRSYTAPFLAHNALEPINFFAHVTEDNAELVGPLQAPEFAEQTLVARLGMPKEKIDIKMTRMGGGFGRRAYDHYLVEAALISQKAKAPIKMIYTREDDMTCGIYRPAYHATYRAALDENNNLIAYHVKAGGIPESPMGRGAANRFPAGAVDNYLAEEWAIESNITIGAFRAPRSNFLGGVEQSFLDEVAEAAGKDPIEFRLELFERSKKNPVGDRNDYDADRYAGVLKLVREKSNWSKKEGGDAHRGVAAYFCHNSYAAHVLDIVMKNGKPIVKKVCSAIDCGIVINTDAASNMVEGAVVDGVGNAFFGSMTFKEGMPEKKNFDSYRMIRHSDAPKSIDVHFVKNEIAPTGLGEPPFPPIFGALANAMYKATGQRQYHQPFANTGGMKI
ncbi:molybdopterin cofactor-binding domain-containing protein [Flammeovirgaceae bacterium SG7u.111]|nr:molybdopterin cofactor-binding domain-containing protein [Flammeovirgaceae bacterium SG7u.132]WPO38603.1 molybdopterin cofactor-binding domain-containing protein [Flammeovirgaceae bacterium SG7u.111]